MPSVVRVTDQQGIAMTNLVAPANGILGRLPLSVYERLQPHLKPVTLKFKSGVIDQSVVRPPSTSLRRPEAF